MAETVNVCIHIEDKLSKYYLLATIFIGIVYVANIIWNFYVFVVNENPIHSRMFYVPDSLLDCMNDFYEIPIHTRITDSHTLIVANQIGALIGQLIRENQSTTSVKIMAYTSS